MIAIALACGPSLLFADEPTTALDVTVQSQILDLIEDERRERNMSLILVTHDLGVVAGHTDEIAVMYGGRLVEKAPTKTLFANMKMPYTEALMASIPKLEQPSHSRLKHDPWPATGPRQPAQRVPVRASLRVRPRALPRRASAPGARRQRRPRLRLLVPGRLPRVPRAAPRARQRAGRCAGRSRRAADRAGVVRGRLLMAGTGKAHLRDADDVLLRVEDLVVEFPVGRTGLGGERRVGDQLRRPPGRDARAGRRIGLRQEHDGPGDHAAAPTDSRDRALRGQGADEHADGRHAAGPDAHADDLPGPDLVAEPAAQGPGHRHGAADDLEARHLRRARRSSSTRRSRRSASTRSGRRRARPTSSPADSASASRSLDRWSSTRA